MKRTLIALVALTASFPALADDPNGFDPAAACAPDDTACLERARQGEDDTTGSTGATESKGVETAGAATERDDDLLQKTDTTSMDQPSMGQQALFTPTEDIYLEGGRYVIVEEKIQDQLVLHVHEAEAVREAADGIEQTYVRGKDRLEPFAAKVVREAQVGIDDPEVLQALHMTLDEVRPGVMQGEDSRDLVPAGQETPIDRSRTLEEGSQMKGVPSTPSPGFEDTSIEDPNPTLGGDPMPINDVTGPPSSREEAGTMMPGEASPEESTPIEPAIDPTTIEEETDKALEDEVDAIEDGTRPTTIERDIDDPITPPVAPEIEEIEEETNTDETFDDADDVGDQAPE